MTSASRSSEFPERAGAGTAVKPKVVPHSTRAERAAKGKAARGEVPRSAQAQIDFPESRDPLALLEEQAVTRVPELVPIRYGRMLVSPFAFYRGGALIMAADLARTPSSGLRVQLCGDAHLSNFGVFGSPERNLVFDINDFDETAPGPWEWDVKRLAASFAIAGRENGFSAEERRAVVLDTVRAYREAMSGFAQMRNLEVWYSHLSVEQAFAQFTAGVDPKRLKKAEASIEKSRTKDSMQAFEKLTHLVDGEPRIISDPPLIVPIDELLPTQVERDELAGGSAHPRSFLPADARDRPPPLARAVPVRRPGAQGRRRGQRRHTRLDRPLPRHRRPGPAVPADQGGAAVGAGAVRRARASTATAASASSRVSA